MTTLALPTPRLATEALASTALLTDRYELTMLQAALQSGLAQRRAVFEVYTRRLPKGRRYGVVGGIQRFLDAVEAFRFTDAEISALAAEGVVDAATLDYLSTFRFTGNIDGYREGEVFFPSSPILTVEGSFGDAVLLETLALSILNHDSAVAAAAARMVSAAQGRTILEMGSRRTHEEAAVAAARAAYVCGFDATSNLEAARRWGIPTFGSSAHASVLGYGAFTGDEAEMERRAFAAQVAALGVSTTLLVDTFDIEQGIRHAVEAAGTDLGAIRIDSGDLAVETRRARQLLNSLGATRTRIVVTGDLDEEGIEKLSGSPVDSYGVGTSLVVGSGAPTASLVYKLVSIATSDSPTAGMRPVSKRSAGKASVGGRKTAVRVSDPEGVARTEVIVPDLPSYVEYLDGAAPTVRHPQVPLVRNGEVVHAPSLQEVRAHHRLAISELPSAALDLSDGPVALDVTVTA